MAADTKPDPDVEYLEDDILKDNTHPANLSAEIRNPLSGLSIPELQAQVVTFCDRYGFTDKIETFQRAALVAQRPHEFEGMDALSEDDKWHLRRETTHRWRLPAAMYMCIAVVSIGSALQYVSYIDLTG